LTPSRIRARAITATITAAAQQPRRRHGPAGTSVYSAPTRTAQVVSIATEGSAKPPQRNRNATPKGSGRCTPTRKIVVSRIRTS